MDFKDKPQFKKGEIGETYVKNWLIERGWITYSPDVKDRPHYFDMLITKDKLQVIAIDVKTKARLNNWNAQGIDLRHYDEYMRFMCTTKVPFYLFFVDDKCGDVFCADLSKLKNPFVLHEKKIIAWYLDDMRKVFQLSESQIQELSKYDTRNYTYSPEL
jgi:hypothetical protein